MSHKRKSVLELFLAHVRFQDDGHWMWVGHYNKRYGYGICSTGGRHSQHPAHRVAYELFVGPIPDGLVPDHTCHNKDSSCAGGSTCLHRRCVNPDHLEAVTHQENILRGVGVTANNARKTHCLNGHPLTLENLLPAKLQKGKRECAICSRAQDRVRYRQHPEKKRAYSRAIYWKSKCEGSA